MKKRLKDQWNNNQGGIKETVEVKNRDKLIIVDTDNPLDRGLKFKELQEAYWELVENELRTLTVMRKDIYGDGQSYSKEKNK